MGKKKDIKCPDCRAKKPCKLSPPCTTPEKEAWFWSSGDNGDLRLIETETVREKKG
jgi:hypothetical protein